MAILNLENHGKELNKPLIAHDHVITQAFEKEFKLVGTELEKLVPDFSRPEFLLFTRNVQADEKAD